MSKPQPGGQRLPGAGLHAAHGQVYNPPEASGELCSPYLQRVFWGLRRLHTLFSLRKCLGTDVNSFIHIICFLYMSVNSCTVNSFFWPLTVSDDVALMSKCVTPLAQSNCIIPEWGQGRTHCSGTRSTSHRREGFGQMQVSPWASVCPALLETFGCFSPIYM